MKNKKQQTNRTVPKSCHKSVQVETKGKSRPEHICCT
jgi:hypothetical protein